MNRQNFFGFLLILLVIALTFSSQLFAANYYVDKDANGSNNGTSWENAWQSFADINWSVISAGDVINISGGATSKTYYELINIPEGLSGTAGNPIVITASTDAGHNGVVILDGINIPNDPAIKIDGSGYITFRGFDLRRWLDSPHDLGTIGVFSSHHIIIENNTILGWSQGIKIMSSNNCIIRNNHYTTIDSSEIQTDGIYASENTDNIYEKNYINISNGGGNHNDCFQGQDEGPCIIRYNYMVHTGGSALKPIHSQGIFDKDAHGLHQYINNFIYMPNSSTPQQQMNDGVLWQKNPSSGEQPSIVAFNNTVVGASSHTFGFQADDITVKNNLIVMLDDVAITRYSENADKSKINNNLYYKNGQTDNQIILGYANFDEWQSAGGDLNGLNVNPQLDENFHTLPGTPPVNAGANLLGDGVETDINGVARPQGATFDIGAYEVLVGSDVYPPELLSANITDSVTLKISFSELMDPSTSEDPANYSITNGIEVLSATLSDFEVTLTTSSHQNGIYTVTVNNVTDLAGNVISGNNNSAQYEFNQTPTGISDDEFNPVEFKLEQNYPNPFNPSTKIQYSLPTESYVQIKVFDILGNEVAELINERQIAGSYKTNFNAANLPSGLYFARLTAGNKTEVIKMTLLK